VQTYVLTYFQCPASVLPTSEPPSVQHVHLSEPLVALLQVVAPLLLLLLVLLGAVRLCSLTKRLETMEEEYGRRRKVNLGGRVHGIGEDLDDIKKDNIKKDLDAYCTRLETVEGTVADMGRSRLGHRVYDLERTRDEAKNDMDKLKNDTSRIASRGRLHCSR
jgi:hypothetical protein